MIFFVCLFLCFCFCFFFNIFWWCRYPSRSWSFCLGWEDRCLCGSQSHGCMLRTGDRFVFLQCSVTCQCVLQLDGFFVLAGPRVKCWVSWRKRGVAMSSPVCCYNLSFQNLQVHLYQSALVPWSCLSGTHFRFCQWYFWQLMSSGPSCERNAAAAACPVKFRVINDSKQMSLPHVNSRT